MSPTMKAIVVEEKGDSRQLGYKDIPIPTPQENEVVIKNHYIGVNYADTELYSLFSQSTPFVPGVDSAGEVIAVGLGVTEFKVGDRVAHLSFHAYAEYVSVDAHKVAKIPDSVSYETAAAVSIQALTAWTIVSDAHVVRKGEYVLVYAAAGGVGLLICQICRYLGATVIGVVSSSDKATIAHENGAEHVINSKTEDVAAKVKEITNGLGCHAVLDSIGKATFETSLECTRRNGTLVSYGIASGDTPPFELIRLMEKNVTINRPSLYGYLVTREERDKWWGEMFDLLLNGHIKARIYKVYDLKDAAEAHRDIKSRKTTGKLLLKP